MRVRRVTYSVPTSGLCTVKEPCVISSDFCNPGRSEKYLIVYHLQSILSVFADLIRLLNFFCVYFDISLGNAERRSFEPVFSKVTG